MLLLIYGMLRDYVIVQPGGALMSVQMLSQLQAKAATAGATAPMHPGAEKYYKEAGVL